MMILILLAFMGAVGAMLWFQGLWSNAVAFVNIWIAALLSFSLMEPITNKLQESMSGFGYLIDFIIVWILFAVIYGVLRIVTDKISPTRLRFPEMFELVGRSVMAVINAYVLTMFMTATLHAAPLERDAFGGAWPPSLLGLRPDQQFLDLTASLSNGSMGGNSFNGPSYARQMEMRRADFEALEGFLDN